MAKNKQLQFDIRNVKFAVKTELGYDTPKDLAYAESIALSPVFSEQQVYGDGKLMATLASDKGYLGTLIVVQPAPEYEIAMKRKMQIASGLADVGQIDNIEHALYYEFTVFLNGVAKTGKSWLLNLTSGRPAETFTQSKEDPTINNVEYPLTIIGDVLMNAAGTDVHRDDNGNQFTITKVTSMPGDVDYETFGNAVPVPKIKTGA